VGLRNINIPPNITIIEDHLFDECGGLTNIIIGNAVSSIGMSAFSRCTNLANLTMPDSVTSIGSGAFDSCAHLTNIVLSKNIKSIADWTFSKCSNLVGIDIPGNVTNIASNVFRGCSRLVKVTLPDGLIKIGATAFQDCTNLMNVNIPESVTSIGAGIFSGCSLLSSVRIPDRVVNIGEDAFTKCTRLKSVYFEGNAPVFYSPVGLFNGANNVIVYYRAGTTGWESTFAGRPTALWAGQAAYQAWAQSSGLLDKFPSASAETDDADRDGMSNMAEMRAGTDPTTAASVLEFEGGARPNDLADADKTAIGPDQHALYLQTVPGRQYEIQSVGAMGGAWQTETNVTATTTQKRVLVNIPVVQEFYRVVLVP
jgi:hypothetical protein